MSVAGIRQRFPALVADPRVVYLDGASTTQKPGRVVDTVGRYLAEETANAGRGTYPWANRVTRKLEQVREQTARFVGAGNPDEIVFTAGATASLNAVALAWGLANLRDGDEILFNPLDHSSNVYPWMNLRQVLHRVCDRLESYISYFQKRRPDLFGRLAGRRVRDLQPEAVAGTPEITPDELQAIDGHNDVLKIDTRGSMAYRIGHVPGSINIRDDYLDDMLSQGLPFPGSMRLIFICPVGEQSKRLAAFTRQAGFDAVSLAGGIVAWRDAGKKLESSARA